VNKGNKETDLTFMALIIPSFFSAGVLPLPTQTISSLPLSTRNVSSVASVALSNLPSPTHVNSILPVASEILYNLVASAAFLSAAASSSPALVTSICPPNASQNAAQAGSSSISVTVAFPPLSLSLILVTVSQHFAFSYLFASFPL